jgi:hypothetical protein
MAFSPDLSKPNSNLNQAGVRPLRLFGLIFTLAGIGFFIPFFGLPALHVLAAQNWHEVSCTVLESEVVSRSGGNHGEQYGIAIKFAYDFGATHYIGTRYDFSIGTSNIYGYRRDIVDRLPPGTKTICYVNPEKPSQAVMNRGFGKDAWFVFLPLIFIAVGLAVIFAAPRMARSQDVLRERLPPADGNLQLAIGDDQSPLGKFVAISFIALLWNSIISFLVREAYFTHSSSPAGWFLKLFAIPFMLVGLLTILGSIYQFLALFNPRPNLKLSAPQLFLGASSELRWSFSGNYSRIRRLTIVIEGSEKATHLVRRYSTANGRDGPSNQTNTSVFARIPVVDTTRPTDIGAGRARFTLPSDTMHSFFSVHNAIVWSVNVHGEIDRWPDVKAIFRITVAPLPIPIQSA